MQGILLLLFISLPLYLGAQISPKEGSKLNHRLIGFSFPPSAGTGTYTIEIASGNYFSVDSFSRNIIRASESKDNRIILEVPAFGKEYTWRVTYHGNKGKKSSLFHFATQTNPRVDTGKLRLRIMQPAIKYKDHFIAVDGGGVIYDMNGKPVWYIPDANGITGYVADMRFNPGGTITFLSGTGYEMNYNGTVLWKSPDKGIVSGDTMRGEFYHHEFAKRLNGHYMHLGMQILICRSITVKDSSYLSVSADRSLLAQKDYHLGRFGTLIEYDENGNIVWSWKSSDHLVGSDFDYYVSRIDSLKRVDPHDNAFFFDEKNSAIYLGFRNLNRIIKIEYPSGKIIAVYGENFKTGGKETGKGLFCNQHNINRSVDGYLYYFNNNSCQLRDSLPTVVMLREPVSANDTFTKIWEYTCTGEGDFSKKFSSGGNATELPDRSVFINMGSEYSKILIVNRAKEILWSALPERFIETTEKWAPSHQYRAAIISRKDMESMIWNAENHPAVK